VIDLDDAGAVRAADPSDMLGAVAALPRHVAEAYANGRATSGLPDLAGLTSVVCCGMGGSAVAGDVLKQAFRERLGIPVDVNRSPVLPAFAGPSTLVVVSSYSGNTAETLAAFHEAAARGCRILAITGGGTLSEECAARGWAAVHVPGGFQPRAAVGHLTFAMLGALETGGLLPSLTEAVDEVVAELERAVAELGPEAPAERNPAKALAATIGDRIPVIWGIEGIASIAAMRWKTQMNENGKVPAFASAMSELDHNEVVGWTRPYGERCAVIGLRHDAEPEDLSPRFPLSADIARDAGATYDEVRVGTRSALATLFGLVVVGDFASCYVALRRGVDPTPVAVIDRLKAALARVT
jgi:glucose/mannose-6-phosphate isomerase